MIKQSLQVSLVALLLSSCFTACTDWEQMDPAAGNQTYPNREVVTKYDFEYSDDKPEFSDFAKTEQSCAVVKDDSIGSNVLQLDSTGYAQAVNPFKSVKLQNGAAVAFWVKLDSADLTRPLISFGSGVADSTHFYFTANGQMVYSKPGQLQSLNLDENDPSVYKTGMVEPGKWHFVALQVSNTGYQFYVDGKKSVSGAQTDNSETSFQYKTLINFINNAPYMYIGTDTVGVNHYGVAFDDISIIRNQMQESDWNKSAGGSGEEAFQYVIGDHNATVGATDNSSGWWTQFSDYFRMPENSSLHLEFTNHTSGAGNWNNWNLCICTDAERQGDGYSEYLVLRSDAYGWGNSYASGSWSNVGYPTNDDEWGQFRSNMEGAYVVMDIVRNGSMVSVKAVETCPNGKVYEENFSAPCGDGTGVIRAFLIADGSHFTFDQSKCTIGEQVPLTTSTVGANDNSSGWWTQFSDYFTIKPNGKLQLRFTNHTSGAGNWNNWNLCVSTEAERQGDGYSEYLVLRSDAYGWGGSYASGTWANVGYPTNDDEWGQFRSNMEGADVVMTITRSGSDIAVRALETCPNGKVYDENFHAPCGDGTQNVNAFLIADGSHFTFNQAGCIMYTPLY